MSKSYFERRIFGQDGQSDSTDDQAPNLGSLKSAGAPTPSQPYRFRAGRSEQPAITSRHYERGEVGQGRAIGGDQFQKRVGSIGHDKNTFRRLINKSCGTHGVDQGRGGPGAPCLPTIRVSIR